MPWKKDDHNKKNSHLILEMSMNEERLLRNHGKAAELSDRYVHTCGPLLYQLSNLALIGGLQIWSISLYRGC